MKFLFRTLATATLSFLFLFSAYAKTSVELPTLSVGDFNRLADDQLFPFQWNDLNSNGRLDKGELSSKGNVQKYPRYYSDREGFTKEFQKAYVNLVEAKRRELVHQELAQGQRAVIATNFKSDHFTNEDREFARILIKEIAPRMEELYQIQNGALPYRNEIFKNGTEDDRRLYQRNNGPICVATLTQNSLFCNAHRSFPRPKSNAYPSDLDQDAKMCEMLHKQPNGDKLMNPFVVVRRTGESFVAVPLTEAYKTRMQQVAALIRKAADVYPSGQEEPLREYLLADAKAFENNNWEKSDESWSRMNTDNSKWYVRIGPDETYFDPCQEKAGFALTFARVSQGSAELKKQLFSIKQDLEMQLAKLIEPVYIARNIGMKTPEFVEMVMNAGDSKNALGAVVGQTLPNWGKVAQEGRRNWNATNFYTDPQSVTNRTKRGKFFFVDRLLPELDSDSDAILHGTVIHEVTHNIGPDTSFAVNGATPKERFGRLSSILEEMKAQTGASWYLPFLLERKILTPEQVRAAYVSNIFWCFNQISYSGLFTSEGTPKAYGQLAAIQVEMLMEDGALIKVDTPDGWRFDIVESKLAPSFARIMKEVATIKASPGTAEEAMTLAKKFVGHYIGLEPNTPGDGFDKETINEIADRYRRVPKESFEYEVTF